MVADFIAGQFKVAFGSTSGLLPQAAAGKLRALAVSTSQRSPLAPDVPTVAEFGYPGFELTTDFVLLAPGGTPDEIVALLEREVRQAIDTPEFRDRFGKQDIWIVASTSAEAASRIKAGFDALGRRGRAHRHEGRIGTRLSTRAPAKRAPGCRVKIERLPQIVDARA